MYSIPKELADAFVDVVDEVFDGADLRPFAIDYRLAVPVFELHPLPSLR